MNNLAVVLLLCAGSFKLSLGEEIWVWSNAIQFDGTLLVITQTRMNHYSHDGKLIRKLGRASKMPGGMIRCMDGIWDGKRYLIADDSGLNHNWFDEKGRFLKRKFYNAAAFAFVEGKYVLVDGRPYWLNDANACALKVVSFDKSFNMSADGCFQKVHKTVFDYNRNDKDWYFAVVGQEVFVMCPMSKDVFVFDGKFKFKRKFEAVLDSYVDPPSYGGGAGFDAIKAMASGSFVYGLFSTRDRLCVFYDFPVKGKRETIDKAYKNKPRCLQLVDVNGNPLSASVTVDRQCIGVYKNEFLFVKNNYTKEVELAWEPVENVFPIGKGDLK